MVKRARGPARPRNQRSSRACLYLACFYFDRSKRKPRGSFQMVVEATSPDLERCQARLQDLRETTKLFDEPIAIFTDGVIKLAGSFKTGLLVNWESPQTTWSHRVPDAGDGRARSDRVLHRARRDDRTLPGLRR